MAPKKSSGRHPYQHDTVKGMVCEQYPDGKRYHEPNGVWAQVVARLAGMPLKSSKINSDSQGNITVVKGEERQYIERAALLRELRK